MTEARAVVHLPSCMQRTFVVGDVHGCLDELEALMKKLGREPDDRVVLVGDLVAKGPDSQGVVQWARETGAIAVRGNHDQAIIAWKEAVEAGHTPPKMAKSHLRVLDELKSKDILFLRGLPYSWSDPAIELLVVHAGLRPGVALLKQELSDLISMRSVLANGETSTRVHEGVPWASKWKGPELVVFGHDAVRGLQQYSRAVGLDSGCVYGRELTALVLPERKLVSVRAKRAYA